MTSQLVRLAERFTQHSIPQYDQRMSEIKNNLQADIIESMKNGDKVRTGTLRMLLAAVIVEETSGSKHDINEEQFLKLVAREAKKRHESAQIYTDAGRQELADNELAEAKVLEEFLPAQLDDAELRDVINQAIAAVEADTGAAPTMKQMGAVMKQAQQLVAGRADGKRVSTAVRGLLQ